MRTLIAVVLLSACSSTPESRSTRVPAPSPPATPAIASPIGSPTEVPVPAAVDRPEAEADDSFTTTMEPPEPWRPHTCQKKVLPWFIAYPEPAEPGDAYASDDQDFPDDMGGETLDDKLAELNSKRKSGGICDTRHRDKLASDILTLRRPAPLASSPRAWDRKTQHANRDLVRNALALTPGEEAQLARDGLVVPERLAYDNYTTAYYDIHRGQLPVFVSVDSILHAVYASHDQLFGSLEQNGMMARLDETLGQLHCGLAAAAKHYPKQIAQDLDLYLTVARTLLAGTHVPSELGPEGGLAAEPLVNLILAERGAATIQLFGRERAFEASQYTPRGHYAVNDGSGLDRYFRASMWLSRLEFNLLSRDTRSSQPGHEPDPTETPREAVVALALADLAQRSGAVRNIAALDGAWNTLAGKREDVSIAQLLELTKKAGIGKLDVATSSAKLRAAIGTGFVRTTNVHPNPAVDHLPVIATLLGPRITRDNEALWTLTRERGPSLQGVELGYMLGHDRALAHVQPSPELRQRLDDARTGLAAMQPGDDLYGAWLSAIRSLADKPRGAKPSFMDTPAFADLRLDSALVAYGQLRHNYVLLTPDVYDQGGCEIPDGYVEPAPTTYRALATYAKRGHAVYKLLDPKDATGGVGYFKKLEKLMNVLAALSDEQLAGRPLSAEAKRFLAMIVERRVASAATYMSTYPVATFDGWYLDLFPNIDTALHDASFVADYASFNRDGQAGIHYLGAKGPRLGVFVVDAGGAPRMMVGPVANGFQHTGPLDKRLTDEEAPQVPGRSPWADSYVVKAPDVPAFKAAFQRPQPAKKYPRPGDRTSSDLPPNTLRVTTSEDLGMVTVEFLDHHFVAMGSATVRVGAGITDVPAPATKQPIEAMWIKTATFQRRIDLSLEGKVNLDVEVTDPSDGP